MTKTPISRKTLREQVAEILRKKILNGDIQSGERIVEADLARELQMSRGPVREALRQIEEEGLVVYEPHKGCVVKTMTYDEMQEAYLIRSTLEILCVPESFQKSLIPKWSRIWLKSGKRRMPGIFTR